MSLMIQKWSRYRILQEFFDCPRKPFLIRELSRNTKLAQTAVRLHLKALLSEGLIKKEKDGLYPSFNAVREDSLFKLLKAQNMILQLHSTGALSALEKSFYPTCVVLFGSASRGEDTENSDIDMFIQAKSAGIDLSKFEAVLNRKINLLFEPKLKALSPELLNNIINGTLLYGYLKVV